MDIITLKNLSVGYSNTRIISNIDLKLKNGEFISLLGPNGAGKTTLLRTISRHIQPLSGEILLKSRPITYYSQDRLAKIMAVVLTEKVTPPLFSAYQFVALGRYPYTNFLGRLKAADREAVEEALSQVNALDLKERDFSSLSDGERQKVLLARAICQEPELLLLDEPTAHLDLKHRIEIMSILRKLCMDKSMTILCSMHDVDIASKVSDRIVIVKDGAVKNSGYPEEVLTSETVAWLYDFDSACFNCHLGSIEIRGHGHKAKIFVVAGMGSGANLYRMLAKKGYDIQTGILLSNDVDCYVANSLGAECVKFNPAVQPDQTVMNSALSKVARCDLVIDAGFPGDKAYQWNLTLLEKAAEMGKTVLSLRKVPDPNLSGSTEGKIIRLNSTGRLFEIMEGQT